MSVIFELSNADKCPLTSQNFLKLCEGTEYYQYIFHFLINLVIKYLLFLELIHRVKDYIT